MTLRHAGLETERLTHLYPALNRVYQALLRGQSREELFQRICAAFVEGGFQLVWLGWHDRDSRTLVPVCHAGAQSAYLEGMGRCLSATLESDSPPGRALRSGRACVFSDVLDEPAMQPFRAALARAGGRACVVLPIHQNGEICGTLSVHSDRTNAFLDAEMALLTEVAADISLAISKQAQEETRRKAEETGKCIAGIVESTDDAIVSQTLGGTITSWNPAAQGMFGYSASEAIGASIGVVIPSDRAGEEPSILNRVKQGEGVKLFESVRMRKDGTSFPVSITYSPIWGVDGGRRTVVGASKIVRDISERKQAEAIAERERRLVTSLIEALPGVFYLYEQSGRFLRWNENFERVSGYSTAEISAMHPLDFFAPEGRPLVAERIADVFTHGDSSIEAPFIARSGHAVPYLFTGRRVTLDGTTCLIGVGVDISERERAQEQHRKSEERYRTTLDNTLEGCQLLDFDWHYLYLNGAAAIHNRRANAELLGKRMPDAWPGIEATEVFAMLKRCMEQRIALHAEVDFMFADGSAGWFDVRAQPVPEGIFVLSIDISERKQAEKALRELNEELERKVRERTRDLEAARQHAEAADRMKSAFLATMSHELRTPLNSILGFTGIVLQGMAGTLNAEQTKQLGMVQSSGRHLLDLINDVLDISKIEAGQLEVCSAPFDLAASIERVTGSVAPLLEKKRLILRVVVPRELDTMQSDRRRIEQILLNLLNNAIKFTQQGTITIEAKLVDGFVPVGASMAQPAVQISVADTGIGIDRANIATAFLPFRQLDTGIQRQHEGTGLGLAICRRLTELLGGTIEVDSTLGKGSVFTICLPMKRT
jgi:PAS domain S-box-containing protein